MKCYVGVDLGSTTTKAVVLNEAEELLGRGITNSRSNYDIACAVARAEAFINARFGLFAAQLHESSLEEADRKDLTAGLERHFRREQHTVQNQLLDRIMRAEATREKYAHLREELEAALDGVLRAVATEIPELFEPNVPRRSDFFRDVATTAFMSRAEAVRGEAVSFDLLMSIFDRAILQVENEELDLSFEGNIGPALERVVAEGGERWGGAADEVKALVAEVGAIVLDEVNSVGTGYGRNKLPFEKDQIRSEILCHGLGAHWMFPKTATVLDIGGQDTKAIQVDDQGIVTSFQMNDRCAAGCGRYLGYIADEMNLGVHEIGPLAQKSCRSIKISSTCTVFAGAELRDRLTLGDKREDVLAGLHRAMMLRAMSLLARSGGIDDEFTFTGGVAKNPAAVDALHRLVAENYGDRTINISPDSIYTGAIGAAIFAKRDQVERAVSAA
jgi:benzoyl-CoA reductase subunit A